MYDLFIVEALPVKEWFDSLPLNQGFRFQYPVATNEISCLKCVESVQSDHTHDPSQCDQDCFRAVLSGDKLDVVVRNTLIIPPNQTVWPALLRITLLNT